MSDNCSREIADKLGFPELQFRDIRPRSAHDAKTAGQDPQKHLHHERGSTTRRYTNRYGIEYVEVDPLPAPLAR